MFLTREDYLKIEAYLKLNSKKDSDFPLLEDYSSLKEDDCVVVSQSQSNGLHLNVRFKLTDVLKGFLASNMEIDTGLPTLNSEKLVTSGKVWSAIDTATHNIPFENLATDVLTNINNAIKKIRVNGKYATNAEQGIVELYLPYAKSDTPEGDALRAKVSNKVAHALTIGNSGKKFDGGANVSITLNDLGINQVFNWIGVSSTYPMIEGATVPGYNSADFSKGTIVQYNDPNASEEQDLSGQYVYIAIEAGHPENPSNWEPFNSSITGFASALELFDLSDEIHTRLGFSDDDEGNLETWLSDINASLADKYVKPLTGIPVEDLNQNILNSINNADTAYLRPDSGIPIGHLDETLQSNINTALHAAYDYNSMIEGGLELTLRKINDWEDLDVEEEEEPTISLMLYPTAKLVKNSIDELAVDINSLKEIFGNNIAEFLTKIQKTTVSLIPDKTLAEIDGSSDNDTITFKGLLSIETFGDYGTKSVNPMEFDRCQMIVDNDYWHPIILTIVNQLPANNNNNSQVADSYGILGTLETLYSTDTDNNSSSTDYYVKGSKTFIEGEAAIGNHKVDLLIQYKSKTYTASCMVATNLRKFFFFGDDITPDFVSSAILNNNSCLVTFRSDGESTVEYNSTSHFSNSLGCTITVPAALDVSTNKYIYMLIPLNITSISKIVQPDSFGADFSFEYMGIITRHIDSLELQYKVYRSSDKLNPNYAKRLTIS